MCKLLRTLQPQQSLIVIHLPWLSLSLVLVKILATLSCYLTLRYFNQLIILRYFNTLGLPRPTNSTLAEFQQVLQLKGDPYRWST
jgi:hypothetical protein